MNKISLVKGEANKVSLKKVAPSLKEFKVNFHWTSGGKLDLDASALVCRRDAKGTPKLTRVDDIVFYGNKVSSDRAIFAGEDVRDGNGEMENIDGILAKISEDKDEVAFILTIDDPTANKSQTFGSATSGKFELVNGETGDVILDFDFLTDELKDKNIAHVASLVRESDGWKVVGHGVGYYHEDGILSALLQFGASKDWFE